MYLLLVLLIYMLYISKPV